MKAVTKITNKTNLPVNQLSRRQVIRSLSGAALIVATSAPAALANRQRTIRVAGVGTVYKQNSHCDVIFGKILEGWRHDNGPGPNMEIAGLFMDQFPNDDMARDLAKKYDFPIFNSIREALTLGTNKLQCDGVISVAEHGEYPYTPDTNQHKYPRRLFFDEIADTFESVNTVRPVFNDKHLSYNWADGYAMYRRAKQLKIPLMAGSSLPFAWRYPAKVLPRGSQITSIMACGYGGLESYGFHALEVLQSLAERRRGGETGIKSITTVSRDEIWKAEEAGRWSRKLMAQALATAGENVDDLENRLQLKTSALYLIDYLDGTNGVLAMLDGITREFTVAAELANSSDRFAQWYRLEMTAPFGHFAKLAAGIEQFFRTRRVTAPIERTLLTTGILDRAMHGYLQNGKRLATPELAIRYRHSKWPFANQFEENFPAPMP
ncbi:MAG: hypothetical protein HN617_16800 [Planctomycetaceae bacterium]|jgi:hypothetical protein|nr:hypothetical protein [Planctomycetaceae bacterium]MBT4723527.1 hypothetical protein [Planctomycetaceae bacterium]MBT4845018.1 hypothetical protein [Planctomycetaceae bacterium]MBT5599852.1 hypothetical protein [Planctomycetaceae bacterium]MBT5885448.1 hypothetical protein [Planctomycetaceae bacterium]